MSMVRSAMTRSCPPHHHHQRRMALRSGSSSSTPQRLLLRVVMLTLMLLWWKQPLPEGGVVVALSHSARTTTQPSSPPPPPTKDAMSCSTSRRNLCLLWGPAAALLSAGVGTGVVGTSTPMGRILVPAAAAAAMQESLDIETFLRTGMDTGGVMGVSSQAGKSRPETGVVLRDGSEVSQDRSGTVSAEILTGTRANPQAVLISFTSPWKLETGPVFDVECRDGRTGDGAFVAVTRSTGGKSLSELPDSFFLERLFSPTGRFSFYGPPTDIKVKKSFIENNQRIMELSFSNLSQSTNAEIPRKAALTASIPAGSENAVILVGSASASRWRKGAEESVWETIQSFRAIPAPKTSMKLRPKDRGSSYIEF